MNPSESDDGKASQTPMRFKSVLQSAVPKGRDGKHKEIVTQLLSDISQLSEGSALKVPLAELPDSKENIRSALTRAATQRGLRIATSSDHDSLFIWRVPNDSDGAATPPPSENRQSLRDRA